MGSRRFYVGNLSQEVKENDVDKLFQRFGAVEKVELKNKTDIDGKILTTFAFVSLQNLSEDDVVNCIQKLNNSKWKKSTIKVQQAQESFLSRLQRERDEAAKPATAPKPFPVKSPETEILKSNKRKTFTEDDYNPLNIVKKSVNSEEDKSEQKRQRLLKVQELDRNNPTLLKAKLLERNNPTFKSSIKADEKSVVSFDDNEESLTEGLPFDRLDRKEKPKVYHSSSDEDDEVETKTKKVKKSSKSRDILRKLESFDGGFWKDEEVTLEHIPKEAEESTEIKVDLTSTEQDKLTKDSFGNNASSSFSLLGAFGKKNEETEVDDKEEEKHEVSDAFALKLKEKAAIEASKGQGETFFFKENDKRLNEATQFLTLSQSLSEVRTNYEEKRPVLASIMKKKLKNRAKRQERMSFGMKKGKRKFGSKFKKNSGKASKHQ